jgi:hypothetical protein
MAPRRDQEVKEKVNIEFYFLGSRILVSETEKSLFLPLFGLKQ